MKIKNQMKKITKENCKDYKQNKLKIFKHNKQSNKYEKFALQLSNNFMHKNMCNINNKNNFNAIVNNCNLTLLQENYDNEFDIKLKKINLNRYPCTYDQIETKYEETLFKISNERTEKTELLLPIKTKYGFFNKHKIEKPYKTKINLDTTDNNKKCKDEYIKDFLKSQVQITSEKNKSMSTVDLLVSRKKRLKLFRWNIGILATEILENPEKKLKNFCILLNYMEEKTPEVYISVRKWATVSLLEIFKDFSPLYNIRLTNKTEVKLKKETLRRQMYEFSILKYYKEYLKKLEKMANITRKEHNTLYLTEEKLHLGTLAIICMTHLLINKQYFNFSSNIVKFLVPFLNSKYKNIRQQVAKSFKQIFKEDKYGQLSLCIVRYIFQYIRKQKKLNYIEIISILLSLRLEYLNFCTQKQNWINYNKSTLQRNFKFYKIERKNNFEHVNKKVQNNKTNSNIFIKITNYIFKIYFYVFNLKEISNTKILSSSLEGLSKFSQHINSYFQKDLVNVLNILLVKNNLNFTEQLYCIHAHFIISTDQSTTLNIDLIRLFVHLYTILLDAYIGKTIEISILIKTLEKLLIHRHKNITFHRLLAFIKRICGISLNFEYDSALAIIFIVKKILNNCKSAKILLNTDCNFGNGIFLPEINDPDYCNAYCTSLWEMVGLQRHYHKSLKNISKNISEIEVEQSQVHTEVSKSSPETVHYLNNSAKGLFQPTIPIPKISHSKNTDNNLFKHVIEKQNKNSYKSNLNRESYTNIFYELKRNLTIKKKFFNNNCIKLL